MLALNKMREQDVMRTMPITDYVAATSVGIVEGEPMLDLAYIEDSRADVDMNVVKTGGGLYIELQGTAEALPFGREALNRLLDLADTGTRQLFALQRGLVGQYLSEVTSGLRAPPRRDASEPGPVRLLIATTNRDKLREIRGCSRGTPVELLHACRPAARRRARGDRRHVRGERPAEGALLCERGRSPSSTIRRS